MLLFSPLFLDDEMKSHSWPEFVLVDEFGQSVSIPQRSVFLLLFSIILPGTYVIVANPCTIWKAGCTHGCLSKGWERWNDNRLANLKIALSIPPLCCL